MRVLRRAILASVALAAAAGVAAQAYTYASPAAANKTVKATTINSKYEFAPTTVKVKVGTKVTWMNSSNAPHTVTSKSSNWKINKMFNEGQKVSFTFKKAGTYKYFCAYHPWMKAKIVVSS